MLHCFYYNGQTAYCQTKEKGFLVKYMA